MEIPKIDDGITPIKTSNSARVKVVSARTLIGVSIQIVEIRPDSPGKFHRKVDLFVFKNKEGQLRGFFNSILRRWEIQPGDTVVLQLITSSGIPHYEPVSINGKAQQTSDAPQELHGLDKKLVIKYATESESAWIFIAKIAQHLPGTKYAVMPYDEKLKALTEIYNRYKSAPQATDAK